MSNLPFQSYFFGDEKETTLETVNAPRAEPYMEKAFDCVYRYNKIWHCIEPNGDFLWVEAAGNIVVMNSGETEYEIGRNPQLILKYGGPTPNFEDIKTKMKWKVGDEDIWDD